MSNELNTEITNGTMIVRFTRPEIRNPLSLVVLGQLDQIVSECEGNAKVDRLIFTGTGDVFASGADLREIADVTVDAAKEFALRGQSLMTRVSNLSQVTIAAINGYCFGGALDLALACDRRIASPNASFAHPGAGLGIITGWGGTQRLPRLIGSARAFEMFFTTSPIDAETSLRSGLVDQIDKDPVTAALRDDTKSSNENIA